jgi:hypothetical protein
MSHENAAWHLTDGDQILGTLTVTDSDFPWLHGKFALVEAFSSWRAAFDEEFRLLETIDDNVEEWEDAYRPIADALTLRNPAGQPVAEFLLHIQGNDAWWRWSDEPFDPATGEPPAT